MATPGSTVRRSRSTSPARCTACWRPRRSRRRGSRVSTTCVFACTAAARRGRPARAVALLALDRGVVISAAHNPPEYNGVKVFDAQGHKLSDRSEEQIEELLAAAPGIDQGRIEHVEVATDSYLQHILERFGTDL